MIFVFVFWLGLGDQFGIWRCFLDLALGSFRSRAVPISDLVVGFGSQPGVVLDLGWSQFWIWPSVLDLSLVPVWDLAMGFGSQPHLRATARKNGFIFITSRSLASGFWPLASGFWSLACGLWPVASGFWPLASCI